MFIAFLYNFYYHISILKFNQYLCLFKIKYKNIGTKTSGQQRSILKFLENKPPDVQPQASYIK